uniref:T9SS type A sorting domain-containing protein n=1 Tax=candidate division WOR-3 bacterium TaxID=2052148 RepID=A0A7C4UG17_UNCW3
MLLILFISIFDFAKVKRDVKLEPPRYVERKSINNTIKNPKRDKDIEIMQKERLIEKKFYNSFSNPKKITFTKDHGVSVDKYNQTYPSIAYDSKGNIYVAMDYYNGSTYEIDIYRSKDYGDNWNLVFYLYHASYNYRHPHIVIDKRDSIYVFYETNDTRYGFQYLESPDGDKWTIYYVSSYTFYPDSCDYPRGAVKDSLIFVTFMFDYYGNGSDYDVGYVYSKDYGASWYDYHDNIAYTTKHERFPVIAITDSVIGVAYELNNASADTDSFDIKYAYTRDFTSWTTIYGIATFHNDRYPDITGKGRYLFISCQVNYLSRPSRDWDIWMKKSSNGGKSWDGSSFLPAETSNDEKYPSIFNNQDTIFLSYLYKDSLILFAETTAVSNDWFSDTVTDMKSVVPDLRCVDLAKNSNQRMVIWTDRRHISYLPNIGYDVYFSTDYPITKDCDLSIYKPVDWSDYLIPSRIKGTTSPSETLMGSEYNGSDTTFVDFAVLSNSPVDVPDTFFIDLYVDGVLKDEFYSTPLPTGWYAYLTDWPILVMGGRHTLSIYHDSYNDITEMDESNNSYGRQWVFFPIILNDKVPKTCKTPPLPQTSFSPPDTFNCDGFRVQTSLYWGAVGIKPPSDADYQLRVYSDHYINLNTGFSDLKKESNAGKGSVDFIMLDGNHLGSGNYFYPGVYKSTGDGDYIIEWNRTDYTLGTSGWNPIDTLPGGSILKVYDIYLSGGTKYYIAVKETLTNENLGFALFSSEDGKYYKARGEWVAFRDTITQNTYKDTAYTPSITDWLGLIVWNNNPSTKGNAIFKVYVGTVPLINELSDFSINTSGNEVIIIWNSSLPVERWIIKRLNLTNGDSAFFYLKPDERCFKDKIDYSGRYRYSLFSEKDGMRSLLKEEDVYILLKTFLLSNVITKDIGIFSSSGNNLDIEIYSINGSKVFERSFKTNTSKIYKINADIPQGVYFIYVKENGIEIIREKITKF